MGPLKEALSLLSVCLNAIRGTQEALIRWKMNRFFRNVAVLAKTTLLGIFLGKFFNPMCHIASQNFSNTAASRKKSNKKRTASLTSQKLMTMETAYHVT